MWTPQRKLETKCVSNDTTLLVGLARRDNEVKHTMETSQFDLVASRLRGAWGVRRGVLRRRGGGGDGVNDGRDHSSRLIRIACGQALPHDGLTKMRVIYYQPGAFFAQRRGSAFEDAVLSSGALSSRGGGIPSFLFWCRCRREFE